MQPDHQPVPPPIPASPVAPMGTPSMPITTPTSNPGAQSMVDAPKGGFWRRFVAIFIDGVVIFLFSIVVEEILRLVFSASSSIYLGASTFVYIIDILYFIILTWKQGATLGKKVMGMKVVSTDGKPLSLIQVILREVVGRAVSSFILGIGYLMVIWDKNKQGLHDKIANTYVIRT